MHLSKFTSILTLLTVQNPHIGSELELLRNAIVKWYEGVQQQLLDKNRAIMKAKASGTEKLMELFNNMDNFFHNLLESYSDPNLPIFYRAFTKIKEEFEFTDVDFDKFIPKTSAKEVQTDRQTVYMYGMDIYETKKKQLQEAQNKISELQDAKHRLHEQISLIVDQNKKDNEDYQNKIHELMQLMEKAKAQALSSRNPTSKKAYRSNPQILYPGMLPTRKVIKNLLNNATYENDITLEEDQRDHDISIEKENAQENPQLMRFLYCQAVTIEQMLQSLATREKAEQYDQ